MNGVRTRKTQARRPRKKVEPLDEGRAGVKKGAYFVNEIELVKKRYAELVKEGWNDAEIAKKIGEELAGRNSGSVIQKIITLRRNTEIRGNPNKQVTRSWTYEELKLIKTRYIELVKEGFNDNQIAKKLSEDLEGRSTDNIGHKIKKLRKKGELMENPNAQKIKDYSQEEVELIKRRFVELVQKGLTDKQIAREIAKELERSTGSVDHKIRKMRELGELADAEALRERQDILGVAEALEEFGEDDQS